MFSDASVLVMHPVLAGAALLCALASAGLLVWFLRRRPVFSMPTKIVLLLGIGVFPIGAAMMGNAANYVHSQKRAFCGSCHVMKPYTDDSASAASFSLAALHARNKLFGDQNCYACHQDYGLFGTAMTKLGGMRHVWEYYTEYKDLTLTEARERIHLYAPYPNAACTTCHATTLPSWGQVGPHGAMREEIESGSVSCASDGCHGPAHGAAGAAHARAAAGPTMPRGERAP